MCGIWLCDVGVGIRCGHWGERWLLSGCAAWPKSGFVELGGQVTPFHARTKSAYRQSYRHWTLARPHILISRCVGSFWCDVNSVQFAFKPKSRLPSFRLSRLSYSKTSFFVMAPRANTWCSEKVKFCLWLSPRSMSNSSNNLLPL